MLTYMLKGSISRSLALLLSLALSLSPSLALSLSLSLSTWAQLDKIDATQHQLKIKVIGNRKLPDESWPVFNQRRCDKMYQIKNDQQIQPWSMEVLRIKTMCAKTVLRNTNTIQYQALQVFNALERGAAHGGIRGSSRAIHKTKCRPHRWARISEPP